MTALCRAFELEDLPSGSSARSRLRSLNGHLRHRLRDNLHIGVKRCLAVILSHYTIDLERVSEGYFLGEEDDEQRIEEMVQGWIGVVEEPGKRLAQSFEAEVEPRPPGDELTACSPPGVVDEESDPELGSPPRGLSALSSADGAALGATSAADAEGS